MGNFTIKIQTLIIGIFLIFSIIIVGVITTVQYKSMKDLSLSTTAKSFDNISDKLIGQIEKLDLNSDSIITLLKDLKVIEAPLKKELEHPLLKTLTESMKNSSFLDGIYIGYSDDSFYHLINLGVSIDPKTRLETPAKSKWLVRKHIVEDKKIIRVEKFLDNNLKVLKTLQKETEYRPTLTHWYKKAMESENTIKTDPYIFGSLKKTGVTYARKIASDSKIVIGIDVSLEFLRKMVASKELVDKSGAYIFKKDGMVIGQYDTFLLKNVENINEKYNSVFLDKKSIKYLDKLTMIKIGETEFITIAKKLASKYDEDQYLLLFSSVDSIIEPLKQSVKELIQYILAAIVLIGIPLIYFVANLIKKPILKLQTENEKSNNVNFVVEEINSLSSFLEGTSKTTLKTQQLLELKVEQRTQDIKSLLDSCSQGFLFFDSQMIIGKNYSSEAKKIFNTEIKGLNIMELLHPFDIQKQQFVTQTLQGVLKDEETKQGVLISLLDKRFIINGRDVEVQYKLLKDNRYMLILTDLTEKKRLIDKLNLEEQTLKMVVEVVTNLDQFLEVKKEYEEFVSQIECFDDLDYLHTLRENVDKYKEIFKQKELSNSVNHLGQFEKEIEQSIKDGNILTKVSTMKKATMLGWLEEDIKILKSVVGDDFIEGKDKILIDIDRIENILNNINKYIDENKKLRDIYQDIDKLTKEHVKVFIEPYKKLLSAFGERMDKFVEPLNLDYDDIYGSSEFQPFTKQAEGVLSKLDSHTNENDKLQELYSEIEKLNHPHIKVFLEPYKKLVKQVAKEVKKEIKPLQLQYDDIFISNRYKPFFNSLVYLFRNIIEDGIETLDERYETSKNASAKISCIVQKMDGMLLISISDDGKEIEIETLRENALEQELYSFKELEVMDDKELLMIIFNEKLRSGSQTLNLISRGNRLHQVYKELKKLDGNVSVKNRKRSGVEFIFTIPFNG